MKTYDVFSFSIVADVLPKTGVNSICMIKNVTGYRSKISKRKRHG